MYSWSTPDSHFYFKVKGMKESRVECWGIIPFSSIFVIINNYLSEHQGLEIINVSFLFIPAPAFHSTLFIWNEIHECYI